ncbi:MAG: hypothetical protein H0X26_04795 [Alphaproteobacteria bacterium]|nr:hypothetical protein [Alphaproteobacteria bacterium]
MRKLWPPAALVTSRALLLFPSPLYSLNQGFFEGLLPPPAIAVEKELE